MLEIRRSFQAGEGKKVEYRLRVDGLEALCDRLFEIRDNAIVPEGELVKALVSGMAIDLVQKNHAPGKDKVLSQDQKGKAADYIRGLFGSLFVSIDTEAEKSVSSPELTELTGLIKSGKISKERLAELLAQAKG